MKTFFSLTVLVLSCGMAGADSLPVITTNPATRAVVPGVNATLSVTATGATSYQWRFNGVDIPGAVFASVTITNAQLSNSGYYMAIAKNDTGWVPSQMAFLSVAIGGWVPLFNDDIGYAQALYQNENTPITNGTARVVAGPELDQMQAVGDSTPVQNGYYDDWDQLVRTVEEGQTVYYRVAITYPNRYGGGTYTQISTTLKLTAGGNTPSTIDLKFPGWPEWPEPWFLSTTPTAQVRVPGETLSLTNVYLGYTDFGIPTYQWRKDGTILTTGAYYSIGDQWSRQTTCVLTISNAQPSDAGVYDVVVTGNNWFVGPKTTLTIQVANGQGVLSAPRLIGTGFGFDLQGVAGRSYAIETSTNLIDWSSLLTLPTPAGTATFSNAMSSVTGFFRARLLPQ